MSRKASIMIKSSAHSFTVLFLVGALFFSSGCKTIDKINEIRSTPSPTSRAVQIVLPEPTVTVSETPFSVNPVYSFYHAYKDGSQDACQTFFQALYQDNTADSLRMSMNLSAHLIALSDIAATVCRLLIDSDGCYSGTVEGAANGTGSISFTDDGSYTFTFEYDSGNSLIGTYAENTGITFSVGRYSSDSPAVSSTPDWSVPVQGPDFIVKKSCTIQKTAEGWISTVEDDGALSTFALLDNTVEFTSDSLTARLEKGIFSITEASEAPAQ